MNQRQNWWFRLRVGLLMMSSGTLFGIPGLGCALDNLTLAGTSVYQNFNPCGTILNCDPFEFEYAIGRLDPYNPDFEECPVSVNPVDCANGVWPPLTGGGGTADDGTTTTGTGTTTGGTTTGTTG